MSVGLKTLVLNSNFMPVSIFPELETIPSEDAIQRYLNENCEVVAWYDRPILTPSRKDLKWPSVIMNLNSINNKNHVRLKNDTLYYRDHGICAYCKSPLELKGPKDNPYKITKDHVYPTSQGGGNDWSNVVASCKRCNAEKGDSLPKGRWEPKHKPWVPTFYQLLEIRKKFPLYVEDESWIPFLPKWSGDVIIRDSSKNFTNNVVDFKCETVAA